MTLAGVALLILRLVTGFLLMGHGSQKLFGWFGGPGVTRTAGWLESLGLRPGRPWALLGGFAEFCGGILLAAGFLNPIGPILVVAAMLTAWTQVHRGKPIWVTSGGAELPLTNLAIALAIWLAGPGAYSLDAALGLHVPSLASAIIAALAFIGVVGALWQPGRAGRAQAASQDRAA